jgi:alpha-L-fucosidase
MRVWILAATACATREVTAGSVPIQLNAYFNNQAFGTYPGESSFDGLNQSYPAAASHYFGNETFVSSTGIIYAAPGYRGVSKLDNVICAGQTILLAKPKPAFAISVLHAGDTRKNTILGNITLTYSDGSMCVVPFSRIDARGHSD